MCSVVPYEGSSDRRSVQHSRSTESSSDESTSGCTQANLSEITCFEDRDERVVFSLRVER